MIDLEEMFIYQKLNEDKAIAYGFVKSVQNYQAVFPLQKGKFYMLVDIDLKSNINFKVYEKESKEEYGLVHVPSAKGSFLATINEECEKILLKVRDNCFDVETLKAEQTRRLLQYLKEKFQVDVEYPWPEYPSYAVFRHQDNQKWFGIIMSIKKEKLGFKSLAQIEIIDLKANPEDIETLLKDKRFYPAYHMNKKNWITTTLDGSLSDEELFKLVDKSYLLTNK